MRQSSGNRYARYHGWIVLMPPSTQVFSGDTVNLHLPTHPSSSSTTAAKWKGQGLWGKQCRWGGLLWQQILFSLFCLGLILEFKVLGPNCSLSSFKKLYWKTSPSHYACYRLMRSRLAECKLSDERMQAHIQAPSKDAV